MSKPKKKKKESGKTVVLNLAKLLLPDDEFEFECSCCGSCCRMKNQCVMLDAHDTFNLVRYLQNTGQPSWTMERVLAEYTTPVPLTDFGYPIFTLNSVGAKSECVFFKDGKCSIQSAKPYTCRAYPLTIGPGETASTLNSYLCMERKHHFTGRRWTTSDFIATNLTDEDLEFLKLEYSYATTIGGLLRNISIGRLEQALFYVLLYMYYDFDASESFLPQYVRNIEKLVAELKRIK